MGRNVRLKEISFQSHNLETEGSARSSCTSLYQNMLNRAFNRNIFSASSILSIVPLNIYTIG